MYHKTHIRFVNAHTKRDRRHHNSHVVAYESGLILFTGFGI